MIQRLARSVLFVALAAAHAAAQTTSASNSRGIWLELGAGVGKATNAKSDVAASASLDWQEGQRLLSLAGDAVSINWSSSVAQVALLLGRSTIRPDHRFASISAGIAFVHSDLCVTNCGLLSTGPSAHDMRDGVGLSAAATAAIRAGNRKGVGIGITAFANANSISSFAGVALRVSGGRWR